MKKAIGIDLGTTNSVVAFKDERVRIIRSKDEDELVRSCVSLINDEILVGRNAYKTGLKKSPENTILSVKRLMGGSINDKMVQDMIANKKYYKYGITKLKRGTEDSVAVILGGKEYTPEQISAEILKKLKQDAEEKLGDEVTHAVVTVPAYFTEKQKDATRKAAKLAGLKVQKLLAEPTAAAIAYGIDNLKPGEEKTVMIYDFGGGTFDLSVLNIVDGQYMETGTGGDRWLGGDNIDQKLQELVYKKVEEEVEEEYNLDDFEKLIEILPKKKRDLFEGTMRLETEDTKIQLSSTKNANIYIPNLLEDQNGEEIDIDVTITRDEFEKAIKPFVQRTIDLIEVLLKEISYDMSMIDNILLVGGTSAIPLVKEMLMDKYGTDKVKVSEKPMLAVAEGAGILAHRLGDEYEPAPEGSESDGISEIIYSTNHNYFIEYQTKSGGIGYRKIFDKQMPLPVTKSEILKTTVNNQKIAKVALYSDVEEGAKEKLTLGYFIIDTDLPIESEIVFDIKLDINETFSVSAYPKGQKKLSKRIVLGRGGKDGKAFETIEKYTNEVLQKINSWQVQDKYFKLQKEMITLAETIGEDNSLDKRWSEIDFKIKNAYDIAVKEDKEEKEGSRDENIITGAIMLINEYSSIMRQSDVQNLIQLLKDYEGTDVIGKSNLIPKIDRITDNYIDLFALFKIKAAADIAINRVGIDALGETSAQEDAEYLKQQHDQILSLFQVGKREEGYSALNESLEVAIKYL